MGRQMVNGKKTYTQPDESDESYVLMKEVIEERSLDLFNSRICMVYVEPYVTPTTVARIIRTSAQLKFFSDYDYIVEISKDVWDKLDRQTRKIVIYHELKHIKIKESNDGTTIKYLLVDHNVQDFSDIIREYGIDWFNTLREQVLETHVGDGILDTDSDEVIESKRERADRRRKEIEGRIVL